MPKPGRADQLVGFMLDRPTSRHKYINMSAQKILDVAQRLIQERGVKAMSYADISAEVGIGKPTIHHHFATKAKLIEAVAERFLETYQAMLGEIEHSGQSAVEQLKTYAGKFRACFENDEQMCLCGMLAADITLLSEASATMVTAFSDANIGFLERLIARGKGEGVVSADCNPSQVAHLIFSSLEGGLLLARGNHSIDSLDQVIEHLPTLLR